MVFDRVPKPPGLLFRATGTRLIAFGDAIHTMPEMLDVFPDHVEMCGTDGRELTAPNTHTREQVLASADLQHDIADTFGPTVLEQLLETYGPKAP